MDNQESDFKDYLKIFKRRIKFFIIPSILITIAAMLLAVLLPSVYKSSATILIEEQVIPTTLVQSTVTTYADQRIQMISQRIMTRSNLSDIITKYDLYAKARKNKTLEVILDKMRERINVEPISANVANPRAGGKTSETTIAFTLSFEDESPTIAKKVANELSTIFLKENIKSRTLSAENATLFLTEASKRLKDEIQRVQKKLAIFKQKNLSSLPEMTQLNQQEITALNSRLLNLDSEERSLQERYYYLQGQLALIDPNAMATNAAGNRIFDTKDRLKVLESQYPSLLATYSARHPDVLAAKREIESLKLLVGDNSDLNDLNAELSEKKAEYASVLERYSENHPDVLALSKQVKNIQEAMLNAKKIDAVQSRVEPDNPAYITMLSQLESVSTELKSVKYARNKMMRKIDKLTSLIRKAPLVEKEYMDMLQELDNTNMRYRDVSAREMEAEISQHLEIERKGERFTLIDPPQEPLEPVSPNRPAILFLGLILAMGAGVAMVVVKEAMGSAIYNENAVAAILGVAPLASIPYLENKQESESVKRKKGIAFTLVLVAIIILIAIFHFVFMPLDVFWYRLLRVVNF